MIYVDSAELLLIHRSGFRGDGGVILLPQLTANKFTFDSLPGKKDNLIKLQEYAHINKHCFSRCGRRIKANVHPLFLHQVVQSFSH